MSSIDKLFAELKAADQTAFMPFITAGDPDLDFTAECLRRLDAAGCQLVELGIPYSDPIADGPVIQASYSRALNQQTKLDSILDMVASVSPDLKMPIVMMISYAIIYRTGLDAFLKKATAAGVAGAIVPDMPVDEAAEFARQCRASDFSLVPLITPTTSEERAARIADQASGFIYYVSITGITGEQQELPSELVSNLAALRDKSDVPICVGFGISRPDQAKMLKPVADGIIVGSAIVKRIAECSEGDASREEALADVTQFARKMLAAL